MSRSPFRHFTPPLLGLLLPVVAAMVAPASAAAQISPDSVRPGAVTHGVGVDYGYVYFEGDLDPWQLASLSVRQGTPAGSLIGRVNYADRFGQAGVQLEVDAYPRLPGSTYAYLNVGYAPSGLFPTWRFGGELYADLPGAWEASAGVRELRFDSSSVTLFTGSVGKYVGNYWVSLRPYARPKSGSVSASASLTGRRYFADADHYVGASAGYGNTPPDDATPEELSRLRSLTAGLHGSQGLGKGLFGIWSVGYEREELSVDNIRRRWDASAGVKVNW